MQLDLMSWTPPKVFGSTYNPELDESRLSRQALVVFKIMRDGQWRTLSELHTLTGEPEASISARLRGLRSAGYIVNRRRRGEAAKGIHEYQLAANAAARQEARNG